MRKIFLIIIFLLIAAGLSLAIYYVFFRAAPTAVIPPGQQPLTGQLPAAGPGAPSTGEELPAGGVLPTAADVANGNITAVTALTDGTAITPTNSLDGQNIRYYDADSGKFLRVTALGQITDLSSKNFPNVSSVSWSKTEDAAILEYPDASKIYYNFSTGAQYTIPKHWSDFNFSSTGKHFAAKSLKPDIDSRWLFISNPDGSNLKALEPLEDNADRVTVNLSPTEHIVAYGETGEALGLGKQQIVFVGKNKENLPGLTVEGLNFEAQWSPDAKKLLYSITDKTAGWRPTLWITDAVGDLIGNNNRPLGLETWSDKCVFAGVNDVFCAVPQTLPEGAGLERAVATAPDLLYKVNLTTGAKTLTAIPQGFFNMERLTLSADNKTLFFQDKNTARVYKIQLAR